MSNIILFDGCEKTGKSTIARELSKQLNVPIFTSEVSHDRLKSSFKDGTDLFYEAFRIDQPFLLSFLRQTQYSVIQDRSYPSQYVYPLMYAKNGRIFDEPLLKWTDKEYKKLNAKIILCLKKEFNDEKDEIINNTDFKTIQQYYLQFSKWTECDCLILYTDNRDMESQMITIKEFIK